MEPAPADAWDRAAQLQLRAHDGQRVHTTAASHVLCAVLLDAELRIRGTDIQQHILGRRGPREEAVTVLEEKQRMW